MKKVLVNLIESFLSFFGILIYTRLIYNYGSYNLLITLLFLILFIFFYKYKLSLNKIQKVSNKYYTNHQNKCFNFHFIMCFNYFNFF